MGTLSIPLAQVVSEYPWVTDGITPNEWRALANVRQVAETDLPLGVKLAGLPWVSDEISDDELGALRSIRALWKVNRQLAKTVVDMPFLREDIRDSDRNTLRLLVDLSKDDPRALATITEQDWFKDGLDNAGAAFVVVLARHTRFDPSRTDNPASFDRLVTNYFVDQRTVPLKLAGNVALYGFYVDRKTDTKNFMDQMEQSVQIMEDFMGEAFPRKDVILLFASTDEERILGLNLGTHMVVTPEAQADDERFKVIVHEIAHYYWKGASSDSPEDGVPFWFQEGGSDFMASYVFSQVSHPLSESLAERRRKTDASTSEQWWCKRRLGVVGLDQLNAKLAAEGFTKHRKSPQLRCHYALGEEFFLNLYDVLGHNPFASAWREIYLLTLTKKSPVAEQEVHDIFLSHAPAGKIEAFNQVYESLHGGSFSGY